MTGNADNHPTPSTTDRAPIADPSSALGPMTALRFGAGAVIVLVLLLATPPAARLGIGSVLLVGVGFGLASLLRGFELRAWFGRSLSLHQSQSLQVVLDLARWMSPLQDRRRLEVEFVARETDQPTETVAEWSRARQWWRAVLLPALPAWIATLIMPSLPIAATCWVLTLGAAILTSPHWREPTVYTRRQTLRRHLWMTLTALSALALEAACLVAATLHAGYAQGQLAAAVVFIALGLARAVPAAPFALGLFEVLAIGGLWITGQPQLAATAWVAHITWLALALTTGIPYLSRYKLTIADLFDRRLPALLARSRRPEQGWARDRAEPPADVEVTVAIPAYNERERLPVYLPEVLRHLAAQSYSWEVIVADDGSKDGTGEYVLDVAADEPRVRLVRRERNGGKGRAVLDAVEAARGRFVLIADADGATPIRELEALRGGIARGAEIAVGSRVAPRSGRVRERHLLRALIGKVFYGLVNFLAVPGIGDTQCGFKLLRSDVARALFRELGEFGWAFDVEVLYRAQIAGYRVAEVAVDWHEVAGSKLRPARDAMRMLVSLFRIRARNAGFTGATAQSLLAGHRAPATRRPT